MSGSYGVLNQKYNTLLALVRDIMSSISSLTLQQVLTYGNTTTLSAIFNGTTTNQTTVGGNSIIITDGTTTNTINKTGITVRNSEQNSTHYLTFVDNSTTGVNSIQKTAGIECNPLNNTITATTFFGNLNGNTVQASGTLALTADIIDLNGQISVSNGVGTVGQVLSSGGSGAVSWADVGGNQDLTDVLDNGSETANTATFFTASTTNTISGSNITISDKVAPINTIITKTGITYTNTDNGIGSRLGNDIKIYNTATTTVATITKTNISIEDADTLDSMNVRKDFFELFHDIEERSITLDNSITKPQIIISDELGVTTINSVSIGFDFVSIQKVGDGLGTALQLNTNGTLILNGLGGSDGQLLTYSSGNAVWADAPAGSTTQSGETGVLSTTSGTVTYGTPFATKPYVVLSLNTNSTTVFIPIGVYSHQTNVGGEYIGFTWASATTSSSATISWIATPTAYTAPAPPFGGGVVFNP
jgi:hypothetical protein